MDEQKRKQKERIREYLRKIRAYADFCLEDLEEDNTYLIDHRLDEIQRVADIVQVYVREYEDLIEEEEE